MSTERFCAMIVIFPKRSLLDFNAMTLFFVLQIFVLCNDEKVASFIFEIGSKKLVWGLSSSSLF